MESGGKCLPFAACDVIGNWLVPRVLNDRRWSPLQSCPIDSIGSDRSPLNIDSFCLCPHAVGCAGRWVGRTTKLFLKGWYSLRPIGLLSVKQAKNVALGIAETAHKMKRLQKTCDNIVLCVQAYGSRSAQWHIHRNHDKYLYTVV